MAKEINGKIPTIGFIGIGPMGGKMSRWLLSEGYDMLIYDIDKEKLDKIREEGARIAENNVELVKEADIVMTSLPLSEVWVDVAERELVPNAKPGQIFIDMGTVTPPECRRVSALFEEKGASFIDCPVSNSGPTMAHKMHLFIGGSKPIVDAVWPIFEALGLKDHVVYCGPVGSGQITKGVNQLAIGLVQAAFAECFAFGVRSGVDPQALVDAIGHKDEVGFRGQFYNVGTKIIEGEGNKLVCKHGQLTHYLKEAASRQYELPMTKALYEFLKDTPNTIRDANRMSPSLWDELMNRKY